MKKPLVSVVITAFEREKFLYETLKSVLRQTYDNLEIIVVDDGSPHNGLELLCNQFKTVSYYKIKNSGGPAAPRNYGITKAKGIYIAFLDDDDIWLPNKLEEQVSILQNNNEFGLIHCYCNIIDEAGKLNGETVGKPGHVGVKHGDVKMKMIGNWTLMMPTPLLRRSLIDEVGLFNINIPPALEDVEFWTRCSFYTKFYYLDKPLANYRIHNSNISSSNKNYVDLPLYLKKVLKTQLFENRITEKEYIKLIQNVCFSQAKSIKKFPLRTFLNLFKINSFWMINFRVLKVLSKRLVK